MSRRRRLTVRARLTLLYSGLFAACGAVVVTASYVLVAQLGANATTRQAGVARPGFVSMCATKGSGGNGAIAAKCNAYFRQLGAQHQRALMLSHLLEYSLITLVVVIALAAALGWILAGRALRPVQMISAAARAASEENLSARVGLQGPRDELRDLAETFDEMLGRLEGAFESQRQFIANASHELRTPLAVMRTSADVVAGDPDSTPGQLREMAAEIRTEVDRAEGLIAALLILARNDRGLALREEVDLAAVVEDVLGDVGDAGVGDDRHGGPALDEDLGIHLDGDLGTDGLHRHVALEPAIISGDPVLAERLVANLVDNARRYNRPGGDLWVSTGSSDGSSWLTVANTGSPVGLDDVWRIFRPFQRLGERTSQSGFGLGLTIVASIARVHGGAVRATPREAGGLVVTVTVPAAAADASVVGSSSAPVPRSAVAVGTGAEREAGELPVAPPSS